MSITTDAASEIDSSSASTLAAHPNSMTVANRIGVAVRPTLLFMTAFALNASPHEATHAVTAYMLGFSSTLYQMWVSRRPLISPRVHETPDAFGLIKTSPRTARGH
jgi:hypothetical protein